MGNKQEQQTFSHPMAREGGIPVVRDSMEEIARALSTEVKAKGKKFTFFLDRFAPESFGHPRLELTPHLLSAELRAGDGAILFKTGVYMTKAGREGIEVRAASDTALYVLTLSSDIFNLTALPFSIAGEFIPSSSTLSLPSRPEREQIENVLWESSVKKNFGADYERSTRQRSGREDERRVLVLNGAIYSLHSLGIIHTTQPPTVEIDEKYKFVEFQNDIATVKLGNVSGVGWDEYVVAVDSKGGYTMIFNGLGELSLSSRPHAQELRAGLPSKQ